MLIFQQKGKTMKSNTPDYGKIIITARGNVNITQDELARRVGVGKTMISNYETNYIPPSLKTLEKIASALGYTLLGLLSLDPACNESGLELPRSVQPSNDKHIRFIESKNISCEKLLSDMYMDSYITVPGFMLSSDDNYICIRVTDNTMKEHGISKNDFVIIRQQKNFSDGDTVFAVNKSSDTAVIRKYFRQNHQIILTSANIDQNLNRIIYDERDEEYEIIGNVEKILKNPH